LGYDNVININRLLKGIKTEISADYICSNNKGVVITTNKIATSSNLNIVEKYMKELNNIDSISPRLLQYKAYLKIVGISYFIEDTNLFIISNIIERVIKTTHIFDDIILAFHFYIIKAFPNLTWLWYRSTFGFLKIV